MIVVHVHDPDVFVTFYIESETLKTLVDIKRYTLRYIKNAVCSKQVQNKKVSSMVWEGGVTQLCLTTYMYSFYNQNQALSVKAHILNPNLDFKWQKRLTQLYLFNYTVLNQNRANKRIVAKRSRSS